jgi:hypothetical protein
MLSAFMLTVVILNAVILGTIDAEFHLCWVSLSFIYAESRYVECRYAEYRCVKCRYAEYRGALVNTCSC